MNSSVNKSADVEARKYLLQLLTALSVCFMLYRLFILPSFSQLEEQRKQHDVLQQELERYQSFAAAHQDYDLFLKQQSERLAQLQQRLPEQASFSGLLPVWQQQAHSCGVKVSEVKVLPQAAGKEKLAVQQVRIALTGSYFNVLKFVRQLEKSENFVNLSKVNITGDESTGDIKLTAVLNIYLYRDKD